jgi:predicted metalloprotease with PDZ domain
VYDENPSELTKVRKRELKEVDAEYSLGLLLDENGNIIDTVEGMPAAKAGIGPGMKLAAINGRRFSADVLSDALRADKNSSEPLELLIENTEYFKTLKIDYHGGEKYAHLVRDESKPDVLSEIIKAR